MAGFQQELREMSSVKSHLLPFTETYHCQSRAHCATCRDKAGGRQWREAIQKLFALPNNQADFDCPFGIPWKNAAPKIVEERPAPTIKKISRFLQAMLKAKKVSDEIRLERVTTCMQCDKHRVNKKGEDWCRACGCRFSADHRMIANLAAYEEGKADNKGLPIWGCRHPERANGKGWRR